MYGINSNLFGSGTATGYSTNRVLDSTPSESAGGFPLPSAPVNTVPAVLSGSAGIGVTLTSTSGTWTGTTPMSFLYQFKADGVNLGAPRILPTYVTQAGDSGKTITVVVTATNIYGTVTGLVSNGIVTATAPVNTVAPVVTGLWVVGQLLTGSNGTWTGTATISYSYRWLRDNVAIIGATSINYTVVTADSGHAVKLEVTGTNGVSPDGVANSNSATVAQYDISTYTLPEKLMGTIYWHANTACFYFPMETMIRKLDPVSLVATDFTPTNYACSSASGGNARLMFKSTTRILVSHMTGTSGTLYCTEIDTAQATIVSTAITAGGNSNPVKRPAACYDPAGDLLYGCFLSSGGADSFGRYKPDDSVRTPAPGFGTSCAMIINGSSFVFTAPINSTSCGIYKNTLANWPTLVSTGANTVPSSGIAGTVPTFDSILLLNGYYWVPAGDGTSDYVMQVEPAGPSHTRNTIHAGATVRNYNQGSICSHSGYIFCTASSTALAVIEPTAFTLLYEAPLPGGGTIGNAGQCAADTTNKIVYSGIINSVSVSRVVGVPQ